MELRIKLTAADIYKFSMYHFYRSAPGVISVFCTVMVFGVVAVSWNAQPPSWRIGLLAGAVIVAACQPLVLYRKAVRQTQNPLLSKEIFMKLDHNGIKAQQGKDKANLRWKQIIKAKKIPGMHVLYLDRSNAYLIPGWVLDGSKKEEFEDLIKKHVAAEKRKGI